MHELYIYIVYHVYHVYHICMCWFVLIYDDISNHLTPHRVMVRFSWNCVCVSSEIMIISIYQSYPNKRLMTKHSQTSLGLTSVFSHPMLLRLCSKFVTTNLIPLTKGAKWATMLAALVVTVSKKGLNSIKGNNNLLSKDDVFRYHIYQTELCQPNDLPSSNAASDDRPLHPEALSRCRGEWWLFPHGHKAIKGRPKGNCR